MHRIDTPDAVAGQFTDGNPQTGQAGTLVPADYLNDLQENICAAIEHAGIMLSKGDATQLTQAIIDIATGVAGGGAGAGSVPTTREVLTGGLATGGHALDSDVTVTVTKASGADLIAGTEAAKVVTPDLLGALFGIAAPGSEITLQLPGGFIVKLGNYATFIAAEGTVALDFETAFPMACMFIFAFPINASASGNRDVWLQRVSISASGAVLYAQWTGANSTVHTLDGFDYIAFGR